MEKIKIKDFCESWFMGFDDGDKIRHRISTALRNQKKVEVDFLNIEMATAPAMNAAFGVLVKKYEVDKIKDSITIINANELTISLYERVLKNAKQYFDIEKIKKKRLEIWKRICDFSEEWLDEAQFSDLEQRLHHSPDLRPVLNMAKSAIKMKEALESIGKGCTDPKGKAQHVMRQVKKMCKKEKK